MFTWGPRSSGGDPYWPNVALLLHCEGANGSATLVDSSSYAVNFTTSTSQHDISTARAKFGSSSLRVKNASPTSPPAWSGARFTPAAGGAFTFECWFDTTAAFNGTEAPPIIRILDNVNAEFIRVSQYALGNEINVRFGAADTETYHSFAPDGAGWVHIAIEMLAGTGYVYAGGALCRSYPLDGNGTGSWSVYVGAAQSGSGSNALTCHIDEVRFTSGVARYGAPFTPPTAAFPDN